MTDVGTTISFVIGTKSNNIKKKYMWTTIKFFKPIFILSISLISFFILNIREMICSQKNLIIMNDDNKEKMKIKLDNSES